MTNYILDIETVPLVESELLKTMPDCIKNPVMPEETEKPIKPEWNVPKYGGDTVKQEAWLKDKTDKWLTECDQAKQDWHLKSLEAKQKYIDNAALSARTGQVKMIGVYDTELRESILMGWGTELAGVTGSLDLTFTLKMFNNERELLTHFWEFLEDRVKPVSAFDKVHFPKVITFFGNSFDLPFLIRRSWILKVAWPLKIFNGRGFDSRLFFDLEELWKLGNRMEKTGGLNEVAKALGVAEKIGDGGVFWKYIRDNPKMACEYLLQDLETTRLCAERMGVV